MEPMKILIVDDNEQVRLLLRDYLPVSADEIYECADGRQACSFFKKHQPDVVLGHNSQAIEWMKAAGASVPKTHGFVSLNILNSQVPCAGLDQQPAHIGLRAAEILVAKLHRNERGAPQPASLTTIAARWVDGPTIRETKPARPIREPAEAVLA